MKKILVLFCLTLAAPFLAWGAEDVKIEGAVEIHYRYSEDLYEDKGDDDLKPEELYIQVSKEVVKDIEALIKLDGADMNKGTASHKYLEEAQVIFKNVAEQPLALIMGKDEMPFGQDYEQFLLSALTHSFEIDKIWGVHGIYGIDSVGSVAAAFFKRDPENKKDTGLLESYTAKLTVDKLVENLSMEASYARVGKDDLVPAEEDEDRVSVGAIVKISPLTIHGEFTAFSNYTNEDNRDLNVLQVGADYKIGNYLLKARHEFIDDDNDNQKEGQTAVGVSYYFSDKAVGAVEYESITYDGSGDDTEEILVGFLFKY